MNKDVFWFKHDTNFGREVIMRKMAFIYGHWGKGIYWDVIEMLREQSGYKLEKDEQSLRMLCDLIGCKDEVKFLNWFNDCIKIGLLKCDETHFFCEKLTHDMVVWDNKRNAGKQGGMASVQAKVKQTLKQRSSKHSSTTSSKSQAIIEENRIEDKRTEEKIIKEKKNKIFIPPTKEEVIAYFEECGYRKEVGERAFNYYSSAGWKDSSGKPVKNWKQKMQGVWFKEEHKSIAKPTQSPYKGRVPEELRDPNANYDQLGYFTHMKPGFKQLSE